MTSVSDTIKRLAAQRAGLSLDGKSSRLASFDDFGSNPGTLSAKIFVPASVERTPALVVVLHGCTQSAEAYDHGSGWSQIAEEHGFILLYPEQRRQNNANLCFNWFEPGDTRRDAGEALSIRQMINALCERHDVDRKRIFITGLSAGGAMANAMLATYPELFAGGAIIAGLAYGVASSVPEALEKMRGAGLPSGGSLSGRITGASTHKGPWPAVSIWQGMRDHTVSDANAHALVEQWSGVHGAIQKHSSAEGIHRTTRWETKEGFVAVELHSIDGMGHGTPIDAEIGIGAARPFMIDVGVSSTAEIARSWGLTPSFTSQASSKPNPRAKPLERPEPAAASGIQGIIESALRSAGLMR